MGKITAEELQKISALKEDGLKLIYALGEIQYQRIALDASEEEVEDRVKQLKAAEVSLLQELKDKYGNVNINIETGEY